MNNLTELTKHHDEYIKIVKTFGGNVDPQDIVQEMYIRLHNHLQINPCLLYTSPSPRD